MDGRLRELAPISDEAWAAIEDEARSTLKTVLAGRKLVDFRGPEGRDLAAVSTGRVAELERPWDHDVACRRRLSQPLVELESRFTVARAELEAIDRGARDADLESVSAAARELALAEDRMVFHGIPGADGRGICADSEHDALTISDDYLDYPRLVADAIHALEDEGVAGPYAIALGTTCYEGLTKTIHPGGRTMMDYLRRLLDGPVVKAPALEGAAVLSMRGGDFELVCGEDVALAYVSHDDESVELALEETIAFRLDGADAAIWLKHEG